MHVATSLVSVCELNSGDVHLCALPLPTLLENIGGVYAMRQAGARTVVLSSNDVGLRGMGGFDAYKLLNQLREHEATTAILVPQMLAGLVEAVEAAGASIPTLRFLAVGGAPLSLALIRRARNCGLPVYEGYGSTECASVVALNTPKACQDGSVGRVLPHARVQVTNDGELKVSGATALGYAGTKEPFAGFWPTGDLGYIDEAGYLHLTGRRRNMLVTAYGRNIAPEWVESELNAQPAIAQAAVFGDGRPWLSAVLVSSGRGPVDLAVSAVNQTLPDYAQVRRWITVDTPFSFASGETTANGRLCRDVLLQRYGTRIERLYEEADRSRPSRENA
jgi:long-subunit acyl-CoA synthetase (AMP-forming)